MRHQSIKSWTELYLKASLMVFPCGWWHGTAAFYQGRFCPFCSVMWDTEPIREVSDLNGQLDGKQQHCSLDISPLMEGKQTPLSGVDPETHSHQAIRDTFEKSEKMARPITKPWPSGAFYQKKNPSLVRCLSQEAEHRLLPLWTHNGAHSACLEALWKLWERRAVQVVMQADKEPVCLHSQRRFYFPAPETDPVF